MSPDAETPSDAQVLERLGRAVSLIAGHDDADVAMLATIVRQLLAGEEFRAAAGLTSFWRGVQRDLVRQAALQRLVALHPSLKPSALARRVVAGVARSAPHRPRPTDAEQGVYHDLAGAQQFRSFRTWFDEITALCNLGPRNCKADHRPSTSIGDDHGLSKERAARSPAPDG